MGEHFYSFSLITCIKEIINSMLVKNENRHNTVSHDPLPPG